MNTDVKKKIGNALWSAFIIPENVTEIHDVVYGANECFGMNWTDDEMDHLVQKMIDWPYQRNGMSKREQEMTNAIIDLTDANEPDDNKYIAWLEYVWGDMAADQYIDYWTENEKKLG